MPDRSWPSGFEGDPVPRRGVRHRATDDTLVQPRRSEPNYRAHRPSGTSTARFGHSADPVCGYQPLPPRAPVSPPRQNHPVFQDDGQVIHRIESKRVLGTKNAALAHQRLAVQFLGFGVISFSFQNRAKLDSSIPASSGHRVQTGSDGRPSGALPVRDHQRKAGGACMCAP
jgi:hypothetical protein